MPTVVAGELIIYNKFILRFQNMAAVRGRGFARGNNDSPNAQALRRPGEAGMIQRFGSVITSEKIKNTVDSEVNDICEKIVKMDFSAEVDLNPLSDQIKAVCLSVDDMVQCIDAIFSFALKSKWNAHVTALFCNTIGDITVKEAKFRTLLLRKLQAAYKDRNKKYMELDSFLMDVLFLCEIYHHVRIEGNCLKVLTRPIVDYFGMLIDGTSLKEVEVFVDQFPKCYHNLKENDPSGLEILICKLRKQVICEPSNIAVRAMLVQVFENILTDFEPLSDNAKILYESLSKPIVRVCM